MNTSEMQNSFTLTRNACAMSGSDSAELLPS